MKKSVLCNTFILFAILILISQIKNTSDAQSEKIGIKNELHILFDYINEFRIKNNDSYPQHTTDILRLYYRKNGLEGLGKVRSSLRKTFEIEQDEASKNPALKYFIPYAVTNKRPNNALVGSPKPLGTYDVLAFTSRYVNLSPEIVSGQEIVNPQGKYVILKDTGEITDVPFDSAFYVIEDEKAFMAYPQQAGIPENRSTTFTEFWTNEGQELPLIGKPFVQTKHLNKSLVSDNGGPESLIQLSRRQGYPNIYGIDREKLWQTFDPAQAEFTLSQVQTGAQKLRLEAQVAKRTLTQLQTTNSSALLFLQDDGRIVTLTALDDDRAVIVDRGLTRNVARATLQKRYSGEALLPKVATTQQASIIAEDAVREVKLLSYDAEVSQDVVLRNRGQKPLSLQLEYPLLGVTEAKLSQETLAPGESATLSLKMKWRTVLQAPTQNVLVSLQTGDEVAPRLQLAFLLVPPPGVKAPAFVPDTAEAAKLPRAEDDPTNPIGLAKPTVTVGDAAPAFSVVDSNGKSWNLSDLRGKKNLLLTFFPKCFTGGCANHLSSLRDKQSEFDALDVQILAVSVDAAEGEKGQRAFAAQWKLAFALVPDTSRTLAKLFGAAQNEKQLAARMSVLIDKSGVVRWIDTDVQVASHAQDALEKIKALSLR